MKTILITLLLVCISTIAQSQNARMEIGRRTGCFGSGSCTITLEDSNDKTASNYNCSFIKNREELIVLRVFRDKLTQDEHDRILGTPITASNKNNLQFTMEESIALPLGIVEITSKSNDKQVKILEARSYPTKITDEYIDITITQ